MNRLLLVLLVLVVLGCATKPKLGEFNPLNACSVMDARDDWRDAFKNTYATYGVPPHLIMAFIYQESSFRSNARPRMKTVLGIPTGRVSTAYGYPQAKDATWLWYIEKTGNKQARRDRLPDAVDFIGWYVQINHQRSGVSKWETAQQYLAYHDGMGGYESGTHLDKPWLLDIAEKVSRNATRYRQQLSRCFNY